MSRKSLKKTPWVSSSFNFSSAINFEESNAAGKEKLCSKHYEPKPWAQQFFPTQKEDLAVHKAKRLEVYTWLSNNINTTGILLVTGPSGCGKTATINVLAQELNIDVKEWINGITTKVETDIKKDFEGPSQVFYNFLIRGSRYKSVCRKTNSNGSALILIEDFPNIYLKEPMLFHDVLRKFCALSCGSPCVFILSDYSGNGQLVKKLFPSTLLSEINIHQICFNPVSSRLLTQALNRVIKLQPNLQSINAETISLIAQQCNGDVRTAINHLEFIAKKGTGTAFMPSRKRKKKCMNKSNDEPNLLKIGERDVNLTIFRSIGKVLYCKRLAESTPAALPNHLKGEERTLLVEDPENIIDCSLDLKQSFSLFLHHNGIPFFKDIDAYNNSIQYLSHSDIIDSYWTPSEVLQPIATSIAVRGFMFNLGEMKEKSFRPLTKPAWYEATENKSQIDVARRITKTISNAELATEVIPLLAKIKKLTESEIRSQFLHLIGGVSSGDRQVQNQTQLHSEGELFDYDSSEEFIIEEIND